MIILLKWTKMSGFQMDNAQVVLCRSLSSMDAEPWAIIQKYDLGPDIETKWEIAKKYSSINEAKKDIADMEKGMWELGLETTDVFIPESGYESDDRYGSF